MNDTESHTKRTDNNDDGEEKICTLDSTNISKAAIDVLALIETQYGRVSTLK